MFTLLNMEATTVGQLIDILSVNGNEPELLEEQSPTEEENAEPPLKKQKVSEETISDRDYSEQEKLRRVQILHRLEFLIQEHPTIDFLNNSQHHQALFEKTTAELQSILDSGLMRIGSDQAYAIPRTIITIATTILTGYGFSPLIKERMFKDIHLQNMIQNYIPEHSWLIDPFQIVHRIMTHLEEPKHSE